MTINFTRILHDNLTCFEGQTLCYVIKYVLMDHSFKDFGCFPKFGIITL